MPPKPSQRDRLRRTIQSLEGITPEDRSALLGLLNETKRYGLVWEDKPEDAHELLREQIPVFQEDVSRRINASEEGAPHHILIEGDNLHALAALQCTHAGKVDVIYIDPPYNTGNKDFRYNDDYVDKDDAWRHSKWLSFMEKRLKHAKSILKDDGVIFVSIDENEAGQLKLICDEIFGEANFAGQFNWFKSATPPALSLKVKRKLEYILCYERHRTSRKFCGVKKVSKSDDPITKKQNALRVLTFPPGSISCNVESADYGPSMYGTEVYPNRLVDPLEIRGGRNTNFVRFENRFVWTQKKLDMEIAEGTVININPVSLVLSYKKQAYPNEVPPNLVDQDVGVDTTENAGRELVEIMGGEVFDYPKPLSLLRYLLQFNGRRDNVILDFFAGSGTTLHATMALNAEDGGSRQCILVTNNENGICEEVTYERNKRVIQGYTTPKGEKVDGLTANHLHYFKTEFVKREPTLRNRRQLMKLSVDLLRLKENAWDRVAKLCVKTKLEAFQGMDSTLFVVLDTDAIPAAIQYVQAQPGRSKVYVFSPGAYAWDEEFEEVRERIDLCAVPEAIYRALEPHLPAVKRIDDEVAA